jgi:hypothetical protein
MGGQYIKPLKRMNNPYLVVNNKENKKLISVALIRKRTIPTERPPFVDELSANFCG